MRTRFRRGVAHVAATALCVGAVLVALVGVAPAPVRAATTYYVGSNADTTGASAATCQMPMNTTCLLRDAVTLTNAGAGGDTITFNLAAGSAVTLTAGELLLSRGVTITGPTGGVTVRRDTSAGNFRIFKVDSSVTVNLSNLTISGGSSDFGGGIYNSRGTIVLTNATVSGNTASNADGGGIYNTIVGTVTLVSSTVSGNTATIGSLPYTGNGGGISSDTGGRVTLVNSTVSGNTASAGGGGIRNASLSTTTLTNSTVSGNSVSTSGGGGGIRNGGTLALANSIVAGNTVSMTTTADNIADSGAISRTGNNIESGNPLLAPLGNYGGPTQTMPPLPGSPAVDAGDAAVCASTGATGVNGRDQRGVPRPQGTACDIGAVERFTAQAASVVGSTGDGAAQATNCVDNTDTC